MALAASTDRPPGGSNSLLPWLVALVALAIMFAPSYWTAAHGLWQSEEFGHAPIIALLSAWMFWRHRAVFVQPAGPSVGPKAWIPAVVLLGVGCVLYILGRGLSIASVEFLSQWLVIGGVILVLGGRAALRTTRFAWMYLLFMVPLPGSLVELLTGPLKHSISMLVVDLLHATGYPIARTGVMITVGPYQLMVADACSGLNSMFSLAALGTLFIHLVAAQRSRWHKAVMVAAILPIAYVANLVRVVILVLVTYHMGDEAGQGFLHGAAGIVLMLAALILFMSLDRAMLALGTRQPQTRSTR